MLYEIQEFTQISIYLSYAEYFKDFEIKIQIFILDESILQICRGALALPVQNCCQTGT